MSKYRAAAHSAADSTSITRGQRISGIATANIASTAM